MTTYSDSCFFGIGFRLRSYHKSTGLKNLTCLLVRSEKYLYEIYFYLWDILLTDFMLQASSVPYVLECIGEVAAGGVLAFLMEVNITGI
jgi:hypothetical protein